MNQLSADEVDRRVIRRGLRAGGIVAGAGAAVLVTSVVASGGDGRAGATALLAAVILGLLVTAGWLAVSVLLDLIAGARPGRRRLLWTLATCASAFVAPTLLVGAAAR